MITQTNLDNIFPWGFKHAHPGDWQAFVESARTETPNTWTSHTIEGPSVSGRYLRVTLLEWPAGVAAGISEVMASGTTAVD